MIPRYDLNLEKIKDLDDRLRDKLGLNIQHESDIEEFRGMDISIEEEA